MNSFDYFKKCFRQYADFSGRARRAEYWYFQLYSWLFSFAAIIMDAYIFGTTLEETGLFGALYSLIIIIPNLAVSVRRLHDTGRSGWTLLLMLLPIIGWTAMLIFDCQDSQKDANKWGVNPKLFDVE